MKRAFTCLLIVLWLGGGLLRAAEWQWSVPMSAGRAFLWIPPHCQQLCGVVVARLNCPGGPVPYYQKNSLFRRDFASGQMARDLTLFVDDDGTAYHLHASEDNGTLIVGIRRTRLMAATSGCRLNFNTACRSFPGMTNGL